MKLNLPTWATTLLALAAGVLAVLNQTSFGFDPRWSIWVTIALLFITGLGISPLVGAAFRNALHLSPTLSLIISSALSAAAVGLTTIHDSTVRGIVVGVLTFLSGLGFGPAPTLVAAERRKA